MVKLGDKVRDSISGFTGIVTSRTESLCGYVRCGVEGLDKPGEVLWFDEQRLDPIRGAKWRRGL